MNLIMVNKKNINVNILSELVTTTRYIAINFVYKILKMRSEAM